MGFFSFFTREKKEALDNGLNKTKQSFLDKLSRAKDAMSGELYEVLRAELQAEFLYDLMAARRTGARAVPALSKALLIKDSRGQ